MAYVQTASNANSFVTITSVVAGDLLVWFGTAGGEVTALSDSTGDGWTEVPNGQDNPGSLFFTAMWYCVATTAGTHTVTRTGGFANFEGYSIAEYNSISSSPLDVYTSNANDAIVDPTPNSGTTGTTAQANELLVACIGTQANVDYSGLWDNGFTNRGYIVGTNRGQTWADKTVSATGTYEAAATTAGSGGSWQCLIATFKMSGGGGGGFLLVKN